MGMGTGQGGLVSLAGTGSPTQASVCVPRGMSTHPLDAVSQAGDGAKMTDSVRETEGCSGINGVVGDVASTAHKALYSAPPHRPHVG